MIGKRQNVVPIFKKGNKLKAENYKLVSLTCVASKLLEHIVSSSITKHLDSNSILTDMQMVSTSDASVHPSSSHPYRI